MLVIDASAIVEVLTVDPADIVDLAHRVYDAEWLSAPDLVDYEVLNVLRKLLLGGHIDDELAESSRQAWRDLRLVRYPMTEQLAERAWWLRHNATAYDAAYVALAESLDVPLVTTERRLDQGLRQLSATDIESYVVSQR